MQDELIRDIEEEREPDVQLLHNMEVVKREIEFTEREDARRAAFRCKMKYAMEGKKHSHYFFNMEKRNYLSRTMYIVGKPSGELTKDYQEILNVQYLYYEALYRKDDEVRFSLQNDMGIILSEVQREQFEEMITKDELYDGMMTLKRNKTPGVDGLTIEVYQVLWKELIDPLYDMYLDALVQGKLPPTGRRGMINLIPKGGRMNY